MNIHFTLNATSLFIGIITATGIVLTSCSDDLGNNNTSVANNYTTEKTIESSNVADGMYTAVCADAETGLAMNLTVKNGEGSISTLDSNGNSQSAKDIKSFTLRNVGAFYVECKANMSDGTTKEIGFVPQAVTTRSLDMTETCVLTTMKMGLKVMIGNCPFLCPIVGDVVSLIPGLGTTSTDMSVTECFTKLNKQISKLDQKINNLAYEVKTYHDDDQIDAHRQEYNALQINNSTYINKLASITAAMDAASADSVKVYEKQFDDCVVEWAKASTKNGAGYSAAIQYLLNTANGSSDHKIWSKVFDACAERLFPWEHQGYDARDAFRDRDMVINAESIILLYFYHLTDDGKAVDLTNAVEAYKTICASYDAEENKVVRDETHAICQIKGADHLKIDKKVFTTYDNPYPSPYGCKVNRDFTDYVVPGLHYNNSDRYAITALLTVGEAEAIVNYYGGKYTFREILENEAGMTCVNEAKSNKDVVMPLWKSHVTLTKVKDGHFKQNYKFTADKAIYLDNKKNTISSFVLGVHQAMVGDSFVDIIAGRNYDFVKTTITPCQCIVKVLKIDGRTTGWAPGDN